MLLVLGYHVSQAAQQTMQIQTGPLTAANTDICTAHGARHTETVHTSSREAETFQTCNDLKASV